jgi:hypothetical protein
MTTPRMPAAEHAQFESMCAPVDDFETLPTVAIQTLTCQHEADPFDDEEYRAKSGQESLDDLILAGLVAPY